MSSRSHLAAVALLPFAALLLLPSLAAARGALRGTVFAPPGQDVAGTVVAACHVRENRCDDQSPLSKAILVETHGPSAAYVIRGLEEAEYMVIALRDLDGDGDESAGDWVGVLAAPDGSPRTVTPPARGLDVRLSEDGAKVESSAHPAAPSAPPAAPRTPPTAPSSPRPSAADARALEGIWYGVTLSWSISGNFTKQAGIRELTFYPDGRVLKTLPYEGLAVPFDFGARCGKDTPCGTYVVRGDEVHVSWAFGWHEVFRREGADRLRLVRNNSDGQPEMAASDRTAYRRLDRLRGLRLDGEYAFLNVDGEPSDAITFTAEGRFSEHGLIALANTLTVPFEEQARRKALGVSEGSGQYRITDNTLELRYEDGPVLRFAIAVFPDALGGKAPSALRINDVELVRQD